MLVRLVIRRFWLLVFLGAIGGLLAWVVVRDDTKLYERTVSVLLRPGAELTDTDYRDSLSVLQREATGLEPTVLRALGSDWFFAEAAAEALGKPGLDDSDLRVTARPGSNVIDLKLTGPNRVTLAALGTAVADNATAFVAKTFSDVYVLETIQTAVSANQVSPRIGRAVQFGVVLGMLTGLGVVLVEAVVRDRRASRAISPSRVVET